MRPGSRELNLGAGLGADTSSRKQGVDLIIQHLVGGELLVTVKGYPEKSPHMQTRHWFAGPIFDLVVYR